MKRRPPFVFRDDRALLDPSREGFDQLIKPLFHNQVNYVVFILDMGLDMSNMQKGGDLGKASN
jgi:hypothetical protein